MTTLKFQEQEEGGCGHGAIGLGTSSWHSTVLSRCQKPFMTWRLTPSSQIALWYSRYVAHRMGTWQRYRGGGGGGGGLCLVICAMVSQPNYLSVHVDTLCIFMCANVCVLICTCLCVLVCML